MEKEKDIRIEIIAQYDDIRIETQMCPDYSSKDHEKWDMECAINALRVALQGIPEDADIDVSIHLPFKKVVRNSSKEITSIKPCVAFEYENGKTESIHFKDFEMAMRFIGDVKGLLESTAVNVSFLCNCKCDSGILNFENDWVKDFELAYVCPKKGEY